MKYIAFLISGLMWLGATASAQEATDATSEPPAEAAPTDAEPAAAEPTPEAPKEEEEKRSPYYKKVQGWLWIEGFVGPSSYDPDQFGSLGGAPNAPKLKGPEGGFAVGTAFGGPFFLGWFYRQANYDQYKLMKTGLDMQGNFRFIPYVHPMIRISLGYAKMLSGNPYGLTNIDNGGISATLGAGLRIPLVRWMSFLASFDWTFVGLSLRGDRADGSRAQSWILGQQLGGTLALSFHFLGVRKN